MTRREWRHVGAYAHQRFHLGSDAQAPFPVVAPVQRTHADRIARDDDSPLAGIPQGEGEDAVEPVEERRAMLSIERVDHLAIRPRGEGVVAGGSKLPVVVDLAVHGKSEVALGRTQRLGTTGGVDDGEPLVDEDRSVIDIHAAPVRAAMTLSLRKLHGLRTQRDKIVACGEAEHTEDRTHGLTLPMRKTRKEKGPPGEGGPFVYPVVSVATAYTPTLPRFRALLVLALLAAMRIMARLEHDRGGDARNHRGSTCARRLFAIT